MKSIYRVKALTLSCNTTSGENQKQPYSIPHDKGARGLLTLSQDYMNNLRIINFQLMLKNINFNSTSLSLFI